MAVLKLTDQVGGGGAGGRDAGPRRGGGAAPSAPAGCLLSAPGGVCAAARCSASRRCGSPAPRRDRPGPSDLRAARARRVPGQGPAVRAGGLSARPGWAGGGEARGAPAPPPGQRSGGSASPGRRGRLVRAAGRRTVDGEGERIATGDPSPSQAETGPDRGSCVVELSLST